MQLSSLERLTKQNLEKLWNATVSNITLIETIRTKHNVRFPIDQEMRVQLAN